jgi:hypothetical protein
MVTAHRRDAASGSWSAASARRDRNSRLETPWPWSSTTMASLAETMAVTSAQAEDTMFRRMATSCGQNWKLSFQLLKIAAGMRAAMSTSASRMRVPPSLTWKPSRIRPDGRSCASNYMVWAAVSGAAAVSNCSAGRMVQTGGNSMLLERS